MNDPRQFTKNDRVVVNDFPGRFLVGPINGELWVALDQFNKGDHQKRTLVGGEFVESSLPFKPEQITKETP